MSDAVLIFTFSPVQPFIKESRRAADLYAGSQILVELGKAAAASIGKDHLIYPTPTSIGSLPDDIPNRMVAKVPWDETKAIAENAKAALLARWREIAGEARNAFTRRLPSDLVDDPEWKKIWDRQTADSYYWEVYWAAAELPEQDKYKEAYDKADRALNAVKRTRPFIQADEPGIKDSLSGCRQALCISSADAEKYWKQAATHWLASKIKPDGKERLDAMGLVKRFGALASRQVEEFDGFPSTSSVASRTFLENAKLTARAELQAYANKLREMYDGFPDLRRETKDSPLYDPDFPFDGDLLYPETLTAKRLKEDFGVNLVNENLRLKALESLKHLYDKAGERPSKYYAIIVLDGDNMGVQINNCTKEPEHRDFSRKLSDYSNAVTGIARKQHAYVIYNGGDDVLVMAPLAKAYQLAYELQEKFINIVGGSASAGIVITHHQSPLSTALREARRAERLAKQVDGKNAVCVLAMKRSGETLEMRSKWDDAGSLPVDMAAFLIGDDHVKSALSSRFVYDVRRSVFALPEADQKLESELRRLVKRHRNDKHTKSPDPDDLAVKLRTWAAALPEKSDELSRWLLFSRFVAQGGGE